MSQNAKLEFRPGKLNSVSLEQVCKAFDEKVSLQTGGDLSVIVTGLSLSSDNAISGDLFLAFQGQRFHGLDYLKVAQEKGIVAILTDQTGAKKLAELPDALELPVLVLKSGSDPRDFVAEISNWFYQFPSSDLRVVGVTGTNGKTTTTYLIEELLKAGHRKTALLGTIELHLGEQTIESPRTTVEAPVLQAFLATCKEQNVSDVVVEISSHAIALKRVAGLTLDLAVFTNLQRDHLDFHGTMENYFEDKAKIFAPEYSKKAVICVDDSWGQKLAARYSDAQSVATQRDSAGWEQATWKVTDQQIGLGSLGSHFVLNGPDQIKLECYVPFPGEVNIINSALAIVSANTAGVALETAVAALKVVRPIPGRMEVVTNRTETLPGIIVDYAHTPDALTLALKSIRPITPGRIIIVFGSDGDRDQGKRPIMGKISAELADILVVTDENPRYEDADSIRSAIIDGVRSSRPQLTNVFEISPRAKAIAHAISLADSGDTIIITGKGHEPYQEIQGIMHRYNDRDVVKAILNS